MKALIVGASGQVGRYLYGEFAARMPVAGTYCTHPEEGLRHLDITDRAECEAVVYEERPTHVLLPAAATHMDWCEAHRERCYAVNVEGVRHLCAPLKTIGSWLVLFSTDHVFGESGRALREDDPVSPLSVYAKSKVLAEEIVRSELPNSHIIIRTSWVYGHERRGKNFVLTLRRRLAAGEDILVADDQSGSPTYAHDLARGACALVLHGAQGTYHVVGPEWMTRHQLALQVCAAFGLDSSAVRPVPSEALRQHAPRPKRCRLDTGKFHAAVSCHLCTTWQGLRQMREEEVEAKAAQDSLDTDIPVGNAPVG
ncbi:MAG: NAD(P)-dependent oxidoreductase [candidate division NC10 bacterium]|nr:NAD(P)-dependent oxidoreductase [candidate division NC10 bacterium]